MHPLQTFASLGFSIGVLAFVAWIVLAHPAQQSVYGPHAAAPIVTANRL
jgi:hypothetical protein